MDELEQLMGDDMPKKKASKQAEKKPATKKPVKKKPSSLIAIPAFDETRKLSKAKQLSLRKEWGLQNGGAARDGLMGGVLAAARDKFGASKVFATKAEVERLCIGIPMPSLAMEYLLANNVFPLSALVMLAGTYGAGKSTLSYEIMRWFYELSGINVHIDTENKFDADWCCQIMRKQDLPLPFIPNRATSLEEMQDLLTHYLKAVKDKLKGTAAEPGPGNTIPCAFVVDSLAAAASATIQDKIFKEGHATRAHPVNALLNTHYLQAVKKLITGLPFTLVVVNHKKKKTDQNGITTEHTLGGEAYNFHESFQIDVEGMKSQFKNSQFAGRYIRLKCSKNSFGPAHRRIMTRLIWYKAEVEVENEQGELEYKEQDQAFWDWDWATIRLLHDAVGDDAARLKNMGLSCTWKSPKADVECLVNMPALGMAKSDWLPWQEAGKMISENPEVTDRIRQAMGIKCRRQLDKAYDDIEQEYREDVS